MTQSGQNDSEHPLDVLDEVLDAWARDVTDLPHDVDDADKARITGAWRARMEAALLWYEREAANR